MVIIIAIYQYKRLVLLWSEIFSCCGDLIVFLISSKTLIRPVWCGIHETDSHHLGFVPDL